MWKQVELLKYLADIGADGVVGGNYHMTGSASISASRMKVVDYNPKIKVYINLWDSMKLER